MNNEVVMLYKLILVAMVIIIIAIIADGIMYFPDRVELGQAICEEQYGMDYHSYKNKVLKCKDRSIKESYDGIEVEIAK